MNRSLPIRLFLFLPAIFLLTAGAAWGQHTEQRGQVMTVTGPIAPAQMGTTLPHEHVMVDFIGADRSGPHRYDRDSVATAVTPFLTGAATAGVHTLVECTPNYLGRDPELLRRLSEATGVQILTNTGYYGNESGSFLPAHVQEESADQLAGRWIGEWNNGIDGTGVRPGFIKLRVDQSPISDTGKKLLKAAALTHKATGLTIGVHTPDGPTAVEQVDLLEQMGVSPAAFIWIHAQNESDFSYHRQVAERGGWVEFDGVGVSSADLHFGMVDRMRQAGLLDRVMISHDAGWYRVGEPGGGISQFTPYTYILETFIPRLQQAGFSPDDIDQLMVRAPRQAFTISVRTTDGN